MDYFYEVCDKTPRIKSEVNLRNIESLTQNELEKCKRVKHTSQNFDVFDIDEIFNDYNTIKNSICISGKIILI